MVSDMGVFFDVAYNSINKYLEELCGDHVEIRRCKDNVIVVLADGLGSGVKANILATLTSNIAATMLKNGADIKDVVDTITMTLPECKKRGLAYSTFTIIQVFKSGEAYVAEFDNPKLILLNGHDKSGFARKKLTYGGKTIFESRFNIEVGDALVTFSDGVVHAGIGEVLNLGWGYDEISKFLLGRYHKEISAKALTKNLMDACNDLYDGRPGDDATVVSIKIVKPKHVTLFTGPPKERHKDEKICNLLIKSDGKKIVCGGSAGNLVAKYLNDTVRTDLSTMNKDVPPIGYIKGIDLVTEGVLTMSETVSILNKYVNMINQKNLLSENNGAAKLASILINDCTHLTIIMGNAINPAHQNPNFPEDLSIKWRLVHQLISLMNEMGKEVDTVFI
jgi:hypothetical protein